MIDEKAKRNKLNFHPQMMFAWIKEKKNYIRKEKKKRGNWFFIFIEVFLIFLLNIYFLGYTFDMHYFPISHNLIKKKIYEIKSQRKFFANFTFHQQLFDRFECT